ncbi:MAG TPA: TolC family protein [Kofleriaceae bacterium]
MFSRPIARLIVTALVCYSVSASAEAIDLHAAIERAHRAAPGAVAARGRVAEARAGVVGAAVPFTENPVVEGGAGPRLSPGNPLDAEIRIEQDLEPWRRDPRRRHAAAEVERVAAEADAQLRELDREVALAFYDALFAERALVLAEHAVALAQRGASVADRRRRAGEITDLDANLAKAALGRARAAAEAATAIHDGALGELAVLIGAGPDEPIMLRGDLKATQPPIASLATRADVRALDREAEVAITEAAQARAAARPAVGVWLGYQREDTESIVLAGLRFSLPIWNRAHGERAAATAKEHRARDTRAAIVHAASRQVADASAAFAAASRAVATFEREVLPVLDDSEQLLDKTFDAGQVAVNDYLFARQELLAGRREYLERLLAAAKAAVEARYALGVAP